MQPTAGHLANVAWADLEAQEHLIRSSPTGLGSVALLVARPAPEVRDVPRTAKITTADGLAGDCWKARGSRGSVDGSAEPDRQITLMNVTALGAMCPEPALHQWAGDQILTTLNLSVESLPAGSRLRAGGVLLEITAAPHLGCAKFADRFGHDAWRWVNSAVGRELRLRGANARVIEGGQISVGDPIELVS